jgi:hypothetical protein
MSSKKTMKNLSMKFLNMSFIKHINIASAFVNLNGTTTNCWVCVIFFARDGVPERLRRARRGVRGGGAGGRSPRAGVWGQRPRKKNFGPTYFRQFRADIFLG